MVKALRDFRCGPELREGGNRGFRRKIPYFPTGERVKGLKKAFRGVRESRLAVLREKKSTAETLAYIQIIVGAAQNPTSRRENSWPHAESHLRGRKTSTDQTEKVWKRLWDE